MFEPEHDRYICPGGKDLLPKRRKLQTIREKTKEDETVRYRSQKEDCAACDLKAQCCPNMATREITRSQHEAARDVAREIAKTDAFVASRHARK